MFFVQAARCCCLPSQPLRLVRPQMTGAAGDGAAGHQAASTVGGSRTALARRTGRSTVATSNGGRKAGGEGGILKFYTDDAPGLKVGPTTVLVLSLVFMAIVCSLHILGMYRSTPGAWQQLALAAATQGLPCRWAHDALMSIQGLAFGERGTRAGCHLLPAGKPGALQKSAAGVRGRPSEPGHGLGRGAIGGGRVRVHRSGGVRTPMIAPPFLGPPSREPLQHSTRATRPHFPILRASFEVSTADAEVRD
ncbi:unnamed protein product [Prorocentrum cordatum]|uniref:Protein transport protein Sec61 subunit beta n=1 Tax=Prorocentrum cordatum TaxID=2364126 RepID=A0ABN9YA39_9DINO|nr:unnamed protein product [Polarella glacialis]